VRDENIDPHSTPIRPNSIEKRGLFMGDSQRRGKECSKCGEMNKDEYKCCKRCGDRLGERSSSSNRASKEEDDQEKDEEEEEEVEEARPIVKVRDPGCPTEAEREAHEFNHLPFRSWCGECVKGRLDNPPHYKLPPADRGVPEVMMDYGFANKKGDSKSLTILVTKDRDSRAIVANLVMHKGRDLGEAVDQGCANIKRFGNREKFILKTDNEPALIDLRQGIAEKLKGQILVEKPPKGESQSNGSVENAVKLVKGLLRTYRMALERRIDGTLPTFHPVMGWMIEHVGESISKYMVGKDGKTGYERLFGKPIREEGIEFGEGIWFRRRKGEAKDLEERWLSGIWLGKYWGTIDHVVYHEGVIMEARAIQRRPITERWSRQEVEKVDVWPWDRHKKREDQIQEEMMTIPPKTQEEKDLEPPRPSKVKEHNAPKSLYIQPADLEKYSYTKGCRRCQLMREKKSAHGIRHTEACRKIITECLATANDARINEQRQREQEYLTQQVETVAVHRAGEGGEDVPGSSSDVRSPATVEPPAQAVTELEEPSIQAPEEGEDMDGMDVMSLQRDALGIFLQERRKKKIPEKKIDEAWGIYSLLVRNGVEEDKAKAKIWEFYSPPRVTKEAKKFPDLNINGERSFDMKTDADGKAWDFRLASHRAKARRQVAENKPYIVIGSPPCTDWSIINVNCNHKKMSEDERRRRMIEARVHLRFSVELYRMQIKGGRHFLHEHPSSAKSWQEKEIKELRNDPRVGEVIGHMCQYGMTMVDKDGKVKPVRKSTRWMSSASEVLRRLSRKCPGHEHTRLEGGRPAAAAVYPPQLCAEILRGVNDQWEREGKGIPNENKGIYSLEEDVPKTEWLDEPKGGGYWDSVTGDRLPAEETKVARKDEVDCMNEWDVWDIVDERECWNKTGKGPISGRWVDHNKGDTEKPNIRSRYVAQEVARWKDATMFAATPPLEAIRALLSNIARKKGRKLLLIDVRKAYLHADVGREIYVRLPKEMGCAGKVGRLKKCLYGTRDAAMQWEALCTRKLCSMGFQKGKASACCFYNPALDVRCVVHGDDFTFEGNDGGLNKVERDMRKEFDCKVEGRLGGGPKDKKEVRILNRIMRYEEGVVTWEADPRHAEALIRDLRIEEAGKVVTPGVKQTKEEEEEELTEEETTRYRSCAAKANYLSMDRADIGYAAKECCRHMSSPRRCHLEALRRIGRYLKGEPRKVYVFPKAKEGESEEKGNRVTIVAYSDSDFAGCPTTRKSTAGGCLLVDGHLIKHWSATLKTIALSSGEAELAALVKAAGEALGLKSLYADLGIEADIDLHADSSAALGICHRSGVGRVRHLDVAQLWIQERVKMSDFRLHKCLGIQNPADVLTKHVGRTDLDAQLPRLNIQRCEGRASSAPELI